MRRLSLDEIVDRYESALADESWQSVRVETFARPQTDEEYWPTLIELLRIRMEVSFNDGKCMGVSECVAEFPELITHREHIATLAFEEYRLRRAAGELVDVDALASRWQIDCSGWTISASDAHDYSSKHSSGPRSSVSQSRSSVSNSRTARNSRIPRTVLLAGEVFGSFRIVCELGQGALARVYLAQQLDLSERPVVLKVCSRATLEPQNIALLQHPHIVQIFSVHDVGGAQVICMPYAGATTLADLIQQHRVAVDMQQGAFTRTSQQLVTTLNNRQREVQTLVDESRRQFANPPALRLSHGLEWPSRWQTCAYEDIVCELILQVARGLSHAHRLGIVHSDLKPANVLVGDDGQARLVDFNVAQQTITSRLSSASDRSLIGGTLPYMAPEHLQSLQQDRWLAGPSSDLYSLGVIAHQMLSGYLPFEPATGALDDVLHQSIQQRKHCLLDHPLTSADASTDVRSIVQKLLQPEISERYGTADELCEDLERHLANRSLRYAANRSLSQRVAKWSRRHPKLTSATSVATLAVACLVTTLSFTTYYRKQLHDGQAQQLVREFNAALPQALVNAASYRHYSDLEEAAQDATQRTLATLVDPSTDDFVAPVAYLSKSDRDALGAGLSRLERSLSADVNATNKASPPSSSMQQLSHRIHELAGRLSSVARTSQPQAGDLTDLIAAVDRYAQGQYAEAIDLLKPLVERSPEYHPAWLLLGSSYNQRGDTAWPMWLLVVAWRCCPKIGKAGSIAAS